MEFIGLLIIGAALYLAYSWWTIGNQRTELQTLTERTGGRITRRIQDDAGQSLRWLRPRNDEYYLCDGESVLMRVKSKTGGTDGGTEVGLAEGGRILYSKGTAIFYATPTDTLSATLHWDVLWGNHSIQLTNGPTYRWARLGTAFGGFVHWISTAWVLLDEQNGRVAKFQNWQVEMEPMAAGLPELPLLVYLGSAIMFSILESDWGG